jgi:hypothetical protein
MRKWSRAKLVSKASVAPGSAGYAALPCLVVFVKLGGESSCYVIANACVGSMTASINTSCAPLLCSLRQPLHFNIATSTSQ